MASSNCSSAMRTVLSMLLVSVSYTHLDVYKRQVFRLTPPSAPGGSWTESTLWDFWANGPSLGVGPDAGVVSVGGSLYGTTYYDTDGEGCGRVYQLSPPTASGGAWTGTAIHSFGGGSGDGCESLAPLTAGPGGVVYGTTVVGGPGTPCGAYVSTGCGTVFELTPPATGGGAWTETAVSYTHLDVYKRQDRWHRWVVRGGYRILLRD